MHPSLLGTVPAYVCCSSIIFEKMSLFSFGFTGSLLLCAGFLLLQSRGCSLVVVCGLLIAVASLIAEHGL